MVEFTFLEIHLEDSDLTANAPYSHGEKDVVASDEPISEETSSRSGTIVALLIGLGFSLAVAYLVKKRVFSTEDGDDLDLEV